MAKWKGYSSNASLVFQMCLNDIQMYIMEHWLSQQRGMQLVKDYTTEHTWQEIKDYLR